MPSTIAVFGIGNVLIGDDAAGPSVIRHMQAHFELPGVRKNSPTSVPLSMLAGRGVGGYPLPMPDSFHRCLAVARSQLGAFRGILAGFGDQLFVARPEVSGWSAGEHLDHTVKVMSAFLRQLQKDQPLDVAGVNLLGRAVLLAGWIPRGRGRAPEKVTGLRVAPDELTGAITAADGLLTALEEAPPRERRLPLAKHPYFRGLTAGQSARFVIVHNRHHLRIVADIARAAGIRHHLR